MRYFKLTGFDGARPERYPLKDGSIIRMRHASTLPGMIWSDAEKGWVSPIWVEVSDPANQPTKATPS